MFEKASRKKLRFDTVKGSLTTEDLWDLPLVNKTGRINLDDIAKALHKELKSGDDVSFVVSEQKSDETAQLKFDIVIHIINVKVAEHSAAVQAAGNRDRKQQLLAIIAQKENEQLAGSTIEDLRKMVESM